MSSDILSEMYVKVSFQDLINLYKQIDSTGKKVVSEFNKMETKSNQLTKALSGIGNAIATLGIAKLSHDIIQASTKMETYNRMLVNVEGSQEKANKRFEEFKKLAKEPVLDPMNLSKYYVALKSVNVESEISIKFMKSLANAMAGVGAGNQQFALAMEQFVQMAGKGKVMGDDLRAIANSFPQIRKYLVDAFGTAIPEELEKKGLKAIDVMKGLNAEMEKAPKFAGGAQASQDNFNQSLEMFYASLGKNVLPEISKFLNKLTELMDKFGELPEATQKIIGTGVMGGLGLLGIAGALTTINNLLGPVTGGLKNLSSLGTATSATPALGALFGGGSTKTGMSLEKIAITATTVALAAGSVVWAGSEIYKALKRDFTPEEKKEILNYGQKQQDLAYNRLKTLQMEAGNFPNKTLAEINPAGSQVIEGLIEQLGLDYTVWRNKTFAELEKAIGRQAKGRVMYTEPAGPPEPIKIDWSKFPRAEFIPAEQGGVYAGMRFPSRVTPTPYKPIRYGPYAEGVFPYTDLTSPLYKTAEQAILESITLPYSSLMKVSGPGYQPSLASGRLASTFNTQAPVMNEYGVYYEDIAKAEEWKTENAKKVAIEKENLANSYQQIEIAMSLSDINEGWEQIRGTISKTNKEQSILWKNLKIEGEYAFQSLIDNGVDKLFDDFFGKHQEAIDAWNAGGYEMGQSWAEFKRNFDNENNNMWKSWKDFMKNMALEFAKTLAKMLVEWAAYEASKWAISQTYKYMNNNNSDGSGGSYNSDGSGAWGGPIGSGKTTDVRGGGGGVSAGGSSAGGDYKLNWLQQHGWDHSYDPYTFWDWLFPDSEADKKFKAQYPKGTYIGYGLTLSKGGIVTQPTIALIGDNPSKHEAVIPLDSSRGKQMLGNLGNIEKLEVTISLPNATLDSIDQTQVDRFVQNRLMPSIRRQVQRGAFS